MANKILLFIDESGKPDLEDPKFRHFLLTGITVPESELEIISGYFSYIKRKYAMSLDEPFHTYDLLEKPNTKLSPTNAREFVVSMCEFIEACPIKIFLVHTDKHKFQKKYKRELNGARKGILYFLSTYKQFQVFTDYLKKQKAIGNIYADSRYNQDRDILDAYLKIRESRLKNNIISPYGDKSKKLLTSLTFANKFSLTAGLELADFISFTSFTIFQRRQKEFKDIKLDKSWYAIEAKLASNKIYEVNPKLVKTIQYSKMKSAR